jgi:hypothetical protein
MNGQTQFLFEAPFVSESEFVSVAENVALLSAFSSLGFETTKDFRTAWLAINRALLKIGKFWNTRLFREDLCKANHYELNIPGVGVKRFAIVRGHPVQYEKGEHRDTRLINIGNSRTRLVSTLQKRGRPVKPPLPCKPSPVSTSVQSTTVPTPSIVIDPQPNDFAEVAREILRNRNRNQGIVLSVVQLIPADGKAMIDTQTERGKWRPRLKNPPAHVVMPAEIFEIKWKRQKLQYVWILSNEKSQFPVGGVLFLPVEKQQIFYLVTFNVGSLDDRKCTNIHHAEMQAVRWIEEQPSTWRKRIGAIAIWNLSRKTGLGYSPCNPCCADLTRFLKTLRALGSSTATRASITWLTHYDRNKSCAHPTSIDNLRRLASSGWIHNGPGWSTPKSPSMRTAPKVRTA